MTATVSKKDILTVKVYQKNGDSSGDIRLDERFFAVPKVKSEVISQVVQSILSEKRSPIASTKNRGEVRGGGKKPWKQKGTGRARAGSIRSPLWRGGGVTFGPTPERNFVKKVTKKMKQLGLFMALTDKMNNGRIYVIDQFSVSEPKTKIFATELTNFKKKVSIKGKNILLIIANKNPELYRASRNLPGIDIRDMNNLSIIDILKAEDLVMEQAVFEKFEQKYIKN